MKRIRLGMVGGGQGAFIGAVHRIAARLDNRFELVAGSLSSNPERASASAAELGLAPDRSYASFAEMAKAEAAREDGIQAVAIVTPNHIHAAIAEAFLAQGIHVICDKPMTATLDQAKALADTVEKSEAKFFLTHNYTGYPMIRQARKMIAENMLGNIRLVHVEYLQDWLTVPADEDNKQAAWRTDPAQAGGGAIGDIGTHAFNLAGFVMNTVPSHLRATLQSFVPGRQVDDNARIDLRYENGAEGHIWASQVAPGNENALTLRLYGDKGGLSWAQETPNALHFSPFGEPPRKLTRGGPNLFAEAEEVTRVPAGHPEGYLEAFATLYSETADAIEGKDNPHLIDAGAGLEGVTFVALSQKSSAEGSVWLPFKT